VVEFRMPSLGADMEAGTLVEWLIKPGDWVKRGDIVAVVETQKGAIEIETFQAGQVEQILVNLHSKVPVGTPLALIRTEGEGKLSPPRVTPLPTVPRAPISIPGPATPPPAPVGPAGTPLGLRASPAARRLALENGVDLATIAGSGPAGAIIYADVERSAAAATAKRKRGAWLDLDAMRTAIGAAMARSKREIPHYYLEHRVDVSPCQQWLTEKNARLPPNSRLLIAALWIKAVALAARRFPTFNGFYHDNKFEPAPAVHVGVAIAIRGGGLAAPALHDADRLSLSDLMNRMRDLVQRTRAGRIRGSEISDATITVSGLGERGVETLYGIIYPPQVAIVGFGKTENRPWVVDGTIGPRSVVNVTLSGDHRVSDGHAGALFLAEIGKLLQDPDKL